MVVFPAHAGMNRWAGYSGITVRRVPRTREDEPAGGRVVRGLVSVFPTHAGMNRMTSSSAQGSARVPRIRGDEPMEGRF